MKAIVPAAGIGKRLRPHTLTTPKVLFNVAGKPIIGHILDFLIKADVDDIVVVVGYESSQVERYLHEQYPEVTRTVRQTERKGLGHAVHKALEDNEEPILIMLGDTIIDIDLKEILKSSNSFIGVREVPNPQAFGIVEMDGRYVRKLVEKPEKPTSNLAIAGIYLIQNQLKLKRSIERLIEQNVTTKGEIQLTDGLQDMLESGEQIEVFNVNNWYDCGSWDSILATNKILLDKFESSAPAVKDSVINEPCYIASTVQLINSIVGPYVTLDEGAIVKNSIISDSVVAKGATLENCSISGSLIGEHAHVHGTIRKLSVGDYSEIKFD
ncbi:MAG: NTP transferase domain-containing protein [Candidatus Marinimicrobia bacterium]|nr:NTP transferase domain-containing protein [Candidatus Neomarinimicrobiota bacterium]